MALPLISKDKKENKEEKQLEKKVKILFREASNLLKGKQISAVDWNRYDYILREMTEMMDSLDKNSKMYGKIEEYIDGLRFEDKNLLGYNSPRKKP